MSQSDNVRRAFERHAKSYDADRRKLIPGFDDFYGAGLRLIAAETGGCPLRILDLGAGTGLFAALALEVLNVEAITLMDHTSAMLDRAKDRFGNDSRVSYLQGDILGADLGGPWDAVISALAIHHLTDAGKQALYARLPKALVPGGRFINAEQVAGPTHLMDTHYAKLWEEDIRANGIDDAGVQAAADRMQYDLCAPASEQMFWLSDAGFTEVDCLYKNWRFAVLTGRNPA